jgi:hypothetical protein
MEIFLSWSGRRSKAAAEALRTWLPKVNPAFKPWLSTADIDKGARWASDVSERLEAAKAGIICLTPSNLHADWLLWEAGALSKTIKNTHVCTFLIELEPADVKPPLSQFQATKMVKEDILALLSTLNSKLEDRAIPSANLPETFALWWPKLEADLRNLPPDQDAAQPQRSDRDLIEEVLALVRSQSRTVRIAEQQLGGVSPQRIINTLSENFIRGYGLPVTIGIELDEQDFRIQVSSELGASGYTLPASLSEDEIVRFINSHFIRDIEATGHLPIAHRPVQKPRGPAAGLKPPGADKNESADN